MSVKEMNIDGQIYVNKEQLMESLKKEKVLEFQKMYGDSLVDFLSKLSDYEFSQVLKRTLDKKLVNAYSLDPYHVMSDYKQDGVFDKETEYQVLFFQLAMALRNDNFC